MGRKELVALVCFLLFFSSCKNYYYNTKGGIRPKKNKFHFSKNPYKLISTNILDTNSVYINKVNLYYGNQKDGYTRFYRFFSNGRVLEGTSGVHQDSLTLNRINDFNNSGAIIGYYHVDTKNNIRIESFRVKKHEGGFYTTSSGFIRNDSIFLENTTTLNNQKKYQIFTKRNVKGLQGTPDW